MKILFATDGSSNASQAARFLSKLHGSEEMSVTILSSSYTPHDVHSATTEPWFPEWRERESHRLEEHFDNLRALFGDAADTVDFVQTDGNAAQCILDQAEVIDADLIVMGAKGHSLVGRILLGSVSDTVATHANCSVLVVRPDDEQDDDKATQVMLAYDGSDGSRAAAEELRRYNVAGEVKVDVVSVIPTFDFYGPEYAPAIEADHEDIEPRMQLATQQVADQFSGRYAAQAKLVRDDVRGEIDDAAHELVTTEFTVFHLAQFAFPVAGHGC